MTLFIWLWAKHTLGAPSWLKQFIQLAKQSNMIIKTLTPEFKWLPLFCGNMLPHPSAPTSCILRAAQTAGVASSGSSLGDYRITRNCNYT